MGFYTNAIRWKDTTVTNMKVMMMMHPLVGTTHFRAAESLHPM